MAQEPFTKEAYWAKLERLGEDEVRLSLAAGRVADVNDKRALATEWLARKERERKSASIAEQMRVARSANRAAWVAAITAITAAMITVIGTAITLILNWSRVVVFFSQP